MADKKQVIFLMGPTASGKTDLAFALAERLPVEIVNVDASQIYRGLNIGAAKPSADELRRVPHWLIDLRDPSETYSAAEFRVDALAVIEQIHARGRIPLLVGGSMLYFKVLLQGLADLPAADAAVRADIEAEAQRHGWPYLHAKLAEVDPTTAARLHPNHSQRIARALEVYRVSGRTLSSLHDEQAEVGSFDLRSQYRVCQLAITPHDRSYLHQRISDRFQTMLERGFVAEVESLRERGDLSLSLPSMRAVGYRQIWEYLDGKGSYEDMVDRGIAATRQLAKRQLTWLRGWPELHWIYTDPKQGINANNSQILNRALNYIDATTI